MRAARLILLFALAVPASLSARAEQRLIPSPYPAGDPSAHILSASPSYRHQMLIPTPYPRNLGPNAMGDPRIGKIRRHQRLIPTHPRTANPSWRAQRSNPVSQSAE